MARRRPNAFEVSFGEDAPELSLTSLNQQQALASSSSLKRKSDTQGPGPGDNRVTAFYVDPDLRNIELETADLILEGEDPFLQEDGDANDKPIRVLTGFVVYDPLHGGELVPLNATEEDDGVDRQFEAAGYVTPYVENEEDEGQEDAGGEPAQPKYVRVSSILRYMLDYTITNDPVWIETQFAWYILKDPSDMYEPLHAYFLRPRRVAQFIASNVLQNIRRTYEDFLDRFERTVDDFGRTYTEQHIWDAISEIEDAVNECDDPAALKSKSPILRHILSKATSTSSRPALRRGAASRRGRKAPLIKALAGDLDLAVLKKENQNATHVTPRIAVLVQGLVREELVVVGERPPRVDKALKAAQQEAASNRLVELANKVNQAAGKVECHREHFIGAGKKYLRAVGIDGQRFEIGDFVLIPMSSTQPQSTGQIDSSSTIADHFWFAKILYADIDLQNFHVQWLQHSSQTMMQELGNPQELFYNELCDHVSFKAVADKIVVHEGPHQDREPPLAAHEYFVNFTYDLHKATYTSIDSIRRGISNVHKPPYNCPVCPVQEQLQQDYVDCWLQDSQKIVNGVAYGGHNYHYEDFVLYRAETGSANIGFIVGFDILPHKGAEIRTQIYLKRVGRISSIPDLPDTEVRDEVGSAVERNFPDVTVHNQCANEVLRYSIKEKMGLRPKPLTQLYDGKTILPSLTKPHVIVAGVPCQTHSTMNMYKKADDVKSNLILTALSYVDHLRPSLFYFENVPGFTRFTFNAVQSGTHKLEGGLEMGGLKFVVRALLDMRPAVTELPNGGSVFSLLLPLTDIHYLSFHYPATTSPISRD
ncbi:hypothetical protein DXG03_003378 [Asterophora parasitica]|uniref:DNA (cytosine-5-)-methyltransferase n=1 Tax=Asterophora parasitica TaxID=117018 RepID=A0A9P7G258_9AGAR|nr:hypothetical protein DXG03_003378 [Asterophora parasitica]